MGRGGAVLRARPRRNSGAGASGGDGTGDGADRIRMNKCHTFAWSKQLWGDAARQTQYIVLGLVVVYVVLGYFLLGHDSGMDPLECFYFLSMTLTTVGLGDLSPQTQLSRGCAIVLLPLGLVVISFAISMATAMSNAKEEPLPSDLREEEREMRRKAMKDGKLLHNLHLPLPPDPSAPVEPAKTSFTDTLTFQLLFMLAKYCAVILVGMAVMAGNSLEMDRQSEAHGEDFSVVDGLFFATVLATTVGYGYEIVPLTRTTRGLLIPYLFLASNLVGDIIGGLSSLFIDIKESDINSKIVSSTVWVHKADLDQDGKISESDFCLFKLQQMQKVDVDMLNRLQDRFDELDEEGNAFLRLRVDVPDKDQVKDMQAFQVARDGGVADMSKLPAIWRERKAGIVAKTRKLGAAAFGGEGRRARSKFAKGGSEYVRVPDCHSFAWSRSLWKLAADQARKAVLVALAVYLVVGWYTLCFLSDMDGLMAAYYLSATITTVGYGDIAPNKQHTRGFALVMIPFGLVIIGFVLSFKIAHDLSQPYKPSAAAQNEQESGSEAPRLSSNPVAALGARPEWQTPWGKCVVLLAKLHLIEFIGALFFKAYGPEADKNPMTWVDAFYFASVTATSIGYGDITPQSSGGKIFLVAYMLVSTVLVGGLLGEFIDLYVNDVVGEGINQKILDSTTWVHKADIDGDGKLLVAEYVLFKLQQLQKVDKKILDNLIDRFRALDTDQDGYLIVGIDVANKEQAAEIQKISASTGRPLPEIWLDPQYQDTFLKLVPPEILEMVAEEEAETTEEDPASEADLAQIGGSTINGGEDKAEV